MKKTVNMCLASNPAVDRTDDINNLLHVKTGIKANSISDAIIWFRSRYKNTIILETKEGSLTFEEEKDFCKANSICNL
jgi:hypothetical protein